VLRSISTSVALAALLAGPSLAASDAPLLRAELGLAERPEIYLVLSPAAGELTVKARGIVLDRITLQGVWLRYPAPWLGAPSPGGLRAPVVLTVRRAPLAAAAPAAGAAPAATPPTEVRALLDGGLELVAATSGPRTGWWRRLGAALGGAWTALTGQGPDTAAALVLQVPPGALDRVAHLLERDRRILLADARPAS
jgi:hypothetical protein